MRCVVTGSEGFIGSSLTRYLQKRGHEVLGFDSDRDIRYAALEPLVRGADVVFHMAAMSSLPECQEDPLLAFAVNVGGTARVLEACRAARVRRVVFSSTSAVYENTQSNGTGFRETDPVDPDLVYAQTKLAAERLCVSYVLNYGMRVDVLRYFNVYGPGQNLVRRSPPFTAYVARELLAGKTPMLFSDGVSERDYVYVDDVCEANLLCAAQGQAKLGSVYNVASGTGYSTNELYDIVAAAVGSDVRPEFRVPELFWQQYPALRDMRQERIVREVNKRSVGCAARTYAELGWRPKVSVVDGVRNLVESMR